MTETCTDLVLYDRKRLLGQTIATQFVLKRMLDSTVYENWEVLIIKLRIEHLKERENELRTELFSQ